LPDKIIIISRHTVTELSCKIEGTIASSITGQTVSERITSKAMIDTGNADFIAVLKIIFHA
jgi:hypothetical protein